MFPEDRIIETLQGSKIKTPHSVFGHAVYLSIHPGRLILLPFRQWFKKHYHGQYKFARAVFGFDLALIGSVITLFSIALFLILIPSKQFRDDIQFIATVAPHEVVSGASSTLVIDYRNKTKEVLQHPKLALDFPKHFLLQSVSSNGSNVDPHNITLEDIPVGGTGTIHVLGVMFGDVGGSQTFESTLTFAHGTKTIVSDRKIATYTFSPKHSTLTLHLDLPTNAIASQTMSGVITYKNTGTLDIRKATIKPTWPNGFTFLDANTQLRDGAFVLSNMKAGSSGEIHFEGKLGDVSDHLSFVFDPSFVFDRDVYKQETLVESVPILPTQIQMSVSVNTDVILPGTAPVFNIHYKNIGNETLSHVTIGLVSKDPFISKRESFTSTMDTLKPGMFGDVTFTIPIREHVDAKLLTAYENLRVHAQAVAHYMIEAGSGDSAYTKGTLTTISDFSAPLSTPLVVESFARYTSPGGDQIGRGPLPPRVGQKTSYWIFWHIDGTTNPLEHVRFEGTLPSNVSYDGHETSSEDGGITYDPKTRKITWDVANVPPTLSPLSQVFSVAFEVALTPTNEQVGTSPIILKDIEFTGKDTVTGMTINRSPTDISTNLAGDKMAGGKGAIRN